MTALYSICSPLHSEMKKSPEEEPFIQAIEAELGEKFDYKDSLEDYEAQTSRIIYVRTGGTEGIYKRQNLKGSITLLTSGESNSLAASMEILSYLRQNGQQGEILHGTPRQIATAIKNGSTPKTTSFIRPLPQMDLGGIRLGVIGKPSDWLISSNVDYKKAEAKLGVQLVDIPIRELEQLVIGAFPQTPETFPQAPTTSSGPRTSTGASPRTSPDTTYNTSSAPTSIASFAGSEAIYEALKTIIKKYNLSGLTLRCFDLLDSLHNTGCLALSRLNAEGVPSSCEGDIPALISMAWLQKTKGCPGFQCNLSRIEGDELLLAHCAVPLNMTTSYRYMTHFESGIGTAIKGEMKQGPVEIFKISPDLEHYVSIPGVLVRNESKPNLCRTQIVVKAPGAADYFLHEPLANHHIVSL